MRNATVCIFVKHAVVLANDIKMKIANLPNIHDMGSRAIFVTVKVRVTLISTL